MFALIKYLLVDSAALLLINPARCSAPRPAAVLEVWLTQGTELSIISCLQSRGRNFHVFMSWHWWQQACKHSPKAQSSTIILTPFHVQNGQMHVHLNCGIEWCGQQQMLIGEIAGSFSRSALTWLMYRPRPCFDDGPQPYLWQTIFHTHYQGTMLRSKHFFVQSSL